MKKVIIQAMGYKKEHEVMFLPQIGDKVILHGAYLQVYDIVHDLDENITIVSVEPERRD